MDFTYRTECRYTDCYLLHLYQLLTVGLVLALKITKLLDTRDPAVMDCAVPGKHIPHVQKCYTGLA